MQPRMTMARTLKLYKLAEQPQTPGIRPLTAADSPQVRPDRRTVVMLLKQAAPVLHGVWFHAHATCSVAIQGHSSHDHGMLKLYKLAYQPPTPVIRPLTAADSPQVVHHTYNPLCSCRTGVVSMPCSSVSMIGCIRPCRVLIRC